MQTPVVLALLCLFAVSAHADIVNTNVEREIDLTNHLVTFTVKQTVANKGSSEVNEVTLAQDGALKGKLSFLSVKGEDNKPLPVKGNTVSVKIAPNKSVTLKVVAIFTNAQAPFPKAITQEETQLVQFVGNAYYSTPYATEKQTTNIKVPGPVEAATKVQPYTKSDGKVVYGPYSNIAANTESEIVVHFENNTPFLTVTKLVREVEVSHWGNVAVTEDIDLLHSGAVLKGGFSRLDYQRIPNSGRSSVKSFTTQLPAAAEDVYYRDLIGNISTSNMRVGKNSVALELRPRFPLFGGWKTFYTVGYNIPSYEVLSRDGSEFKLSVRFVDHIYDHMFVEKETLRVILPEGAEDIQVNSPFAVDAESRDVVVTYLDTYGRPVVVLTKSNLVEEHMQNVEISYKFSQISLLREPTLLIVFFFLLFSVAIIYNRIDFAIDTQSAVAKSKERYLLCEGELSKLRETLEKSADVVGKDGKLKAPASEIVENIKKIDAELAKKTEDITIQIAKLSADTKNKDDSEDKINELLDRLQKAL